VDRRPRSPVPRGYAAQKHVTVRLRAGRESAGDCDARIPPNTATGHRCARRRHVGVFASPAAVAPTPSWTTPVRRLCRFARLYAEHDRLDVVQQGSDPHNPRFARAGRRRRRSPRGDRRSAAGGDVASRPPAQGPDAFPQRQVSAARPRWGCRGWSARPGVARDRTSRWIGTLLAAWRYGTRRNGVSRTRRSGQLRGSAGRAHSRGRCIDARHIVVALGQPRRAPGSQGVVRTAERRRRDVRAARCAGGDGRALQYESGGRSREWREGGVNHAPYATRATGGRVQRSTVRRRLRRAISQAPSGRCLGSAQALGPSSKEPLMPTDFRFDDLDLREEPALKSPASTDGTTADGTTACTDTHTCTYPSHGFACTSTIC
jgi:hypothetical protein